MSSQVASEYEGLTEVQAFGLLLAYCLAYVLPLHIFPAARASPIRSRDDPAAIRARIRAVSLSTAACSLATLIVLSAHHAAISPLRLMGYWPLGLVETARSLFLTGLLFAGPLYESLLIDGAWSQWTRLQPLRSLWSHLPSWRNIVAGPITEECLFRSAAVPLLLLAGHSMRSTVFISPLVFGLAHVHHFYEFRVTHPRVSIVAAIARSVLQFSYTYLFGIYATFIFLRTGSLLAVAIVHAFCNSLGLPRVWGQVEPYWYSWGDLSNPSNRRSLMVWTGVYYVLLFGGTLAFYHGLYPLSQSPLALADF
ncbi:CAAX prenyl protease-like protein [Hapsidospora chrysogenum ATCC 11550]|uniref:intramembrane prenyl-peptidase Rce1 n=1 Tax=Hapsidospora chrysogenum (strain ATCC 11550 / CBS 779.69 / DSM 880 / IAM 14645 / JCM 23072 / IMI 49137) TaxID=857340 RepID=A0A086T163_HAPC1|nr:CAAX prenyl protease-like protein [Hapsidospora chrysogenum ATCC 11550]